MKRLVISKYEEAQFVSSVSVHTILQLSTVMSGVTYKAIFLHSYSDSDIRRFQLPCNLTTDFKHLKEKLHSYYPSDVIGKISRIDEDGDAVNVDSDDDLKTAVAESADTGVVKLNVAVISGVATEIDNVVNDKNDENNPVLSSLVYTAQTLGLDPTSCGHCDGGHSRDQRPTSVTGYLARMVTGVSVRVTKSVIVMGSLAFITGLSMILPSIIINTLIYMIIAASMGFPLATILSGKNEQKNSFHSSFILYYQVMLCSCSYLCLRVT